MNKTKLLSELRTNIEELQYKDNNLDNLIKKCQLYIRKIFGEESNYLNDLEAISFYPRLYYSGMPRQLYIDSFESGKTRFLNLVDVMIEDIQLSNVSNIETEDIDRAPIIKNRIFIVHGHDDAMKQTIARYLEKLKLDPIILGEQPSGGVKSILEKIEEYSDVNYAVVLLSPCDEGHEKGHKNLTPRARQNVIAELGYFIGKLGRNHVSIVKNGDLEFPSDFLGNYYIDYSNSNWRVCLFQELKAFGFKIDANNLM